MKKLVLLLTIIAFTISCSNVDDNTVIIEEPETESPYANGIIVSNEGNFGSSNSDVSFITNNLSTIYNGIYKLNNSNANLGDVCQFIGFNNDLAYIVVNNSNVIEIVNRYTFKKVDQITEELNTPRSIAFSNGKIYVTNANSKTLTVYNGETFAFNKTISLDFQPEKVVANTNYVYVQSSNYVANGGAIEIINSSSDINTTDIEFSTSMNGITLDKSTGAVYVIGSNENESEIFKIENTTVTNSITSTNIKNSKNLTFDNNQLYFTSDTGIYTISINLNSFPNQQLFNVTNNSWSTLYGFNVIDGKVYTSDAKGFTDNSEITIYDLSGNKLKTFVSQIGTNGFYKN